MTSILIIDDEPLVCATLERLLERNHEVVACGSARQALGLLRERQFDAILCDMLMPEMSGMQFHQELERSHPDLARRIAFMTGGAYTNQFLNFLAQTEQPVIEKPFTAAAIRALVAEVLAG